MPEERRLVSVLFVDIVGSTALGHDNDPEVVRSVLGRYFERAREIAEAHGGTVEKFIGDAVMVVFGVPRLHDDDAERAVRTALAIRDALDPLNEELALRLDARAGVNTGEVVAAIDDRDQFLVTGDVVNVAARLQQSAEPGEVITGTLTEQLTREAVEYAPRPPIAVRGKPEPIGAFAAIRPRSDVPDQARGLPAMRARLVGRTRELRLLLDTFERARDDRRPQLFTIVGNAGVGKSRLVGEFLARIAAPDVRVLRGRCLPYGSGITWWPLMELVQSDLGVTPADSRTGIIERLDARLADLVGDARELAAIRARLTVILGLADVVDALPDVPGTRLAAELGWGLGRFLEALAGQGPVTVVIDDLQWAEPPAIEIVRGVLGQALDTPLVLVCIARLDLLETQPGWGAGQPNAATIVLEPLTDEETRTLIARLLDIDDLPEELRRRLVVRSEGNPLFCEEFVRMLIEEGRLVRVDHRWQAAAEGSLDVRVPESIQALLAARLDALAADEKRLVHAASVIGEEFERDQAAVLTGEAGVAERLDGLARRGLVLPDRRAGPGAYRFRHLLIREVAYATLPKAERARLHERFGEALEAAAGDRRDELTEVLAHHAERALSLSRELRLTGDAIGVRARRALRLALDAALRALEREDREALAAFETTASAAVDVLGPAATAEDRAAVRLLGGQLAELRGDFHVARTALTDAAEAAIAVGRHDLAAAAHLALAKVLVISLNEEEWDSLNAILATAAQEFEAAGDPAGRIAAEKIGLDLLFSQGRLDEMIQAGERLAAAARALGLPALAATIDVRLIAAAAWRGRGDQAATYGTRALAAADALGLASSRRWARFYLARLDWMRGRLDATEAADRALAAEALQAGDGALVVSSYRMLGEALFEAGRFAESDAATATALEHSVRTGERWSRTELLAFRSLVALELGRLDDAERLLAESAATLREDDVAAVSVVEAARGQLAAAQGRDAEAERAFRAAIAVGRATEYWAWTMPSIELAEFLVSRGRVAEAAPVIAEVDATMRELGYGLRRGRIDAVVGAVQGVAAPAGPPTG